MRITKRDDKITILLSGNDVRHLEMGDEIEHEDITIVMDFSEGKESRVNQVSPEHLQREI